LIFWDEFSLRVATINHALDVMTKACSQIVKSVKLKKILGIVMTVGNFLNAGTLRGKQRALRTPTLKKLNEVRSPVDNKFTLLSYLASFVETNFSELLNFKNEISALEEAMRFQPDLIQEEVLSLENGLTQIELLIDQPGEEREGMFFQFFDALNNFVLFARIELDHIEEKFRAFTAEAANVLKTFGHTPSSPVTELWNNFYLFSKQFTQTVEENKRKREEEERRGLMQMTFPSHERQQDQTQDQTQNQTQSELTQNDELRLVMPPAEPVELLEENGMMDKLIALIREGIYSLNEPTEQSSVEQINV